jgi:hypothetical protein
MVAKVSQEALDSSQDMAKNFSSVNSESEDSESSDGFSGVFQNQNYLNQLSELMENIADKGATIAQLKDGTVFVSETRIVVYKYIWDSNKCIFIKQRTRNTRSSIKNRVAENLIDEDVE